MCSVQCRIDAQCLTLLLLVEEDKNVALSLQIIHKICWRQEKTLLFSMS